MFELRHGALHRRGHSHRGSVAFWSVYHKDARGDAGVNRHGHVGAECRPPVVVDTDVAAPLGSRGLGGEISLGFVDEQLEGIQGDISATEESPRALTSAIAAKPKSGTTNISDRNPGSEPPVPYERMVRIG